MEHHRRLPVPATPKDMWKTTPGISKLNCQAAFTEFVS